MCLGNLVGGAWGPGVVVDWHFVQILNSRTRGSSPLLGIFLTLSIL